MSRNISTSKIALLKSQVNAIRILRNLLREGSASNAVIEYQLTEVETKLRRLSQTPKQSAL